jgi:peptidoglycan/LPS O-acetylase OafA/YrhL
VRLYVPCIAVELIHVVLLHVPGLVLPLPWLHPQETIFKELWIFMERTVSYFNPFQIHESGAMWYAYAVVMWTIPIELKGSFLIFAILAVYSLIAPGTNSWRVAVPTVLLFVVAAIMLQMCIKWSMANFILGFVLAVIDVWKLDAQLLQAVPQEKRSFGLHCIFFGGWFLLSQPHRQGDMGIVANTPGYKWLASLIPSAYPTLIHYRYWQSWGALLFVYALLRIEWIQRRLSTATMRFLGRVSFMLYLTHLTFIRIFADRVNSLLGGAVDEELKGTSWDGPLWIPDVGPLGISSRFLVCMAISLPANLLLAKYFTEWIDDPIVSFARRLTAGLGRAKRKDGNVADEEPMLPVSRARRYSL